MGSLWRGHFIPIPTVKPRGSIGVMILTVKAAPIASLPYTGNPDAKVMSVDTSGGIECSRTAGQVPCFVQVSASAIAALGGVIENCGRAFNPYEDLHYSWDFGDPDGTETVVDPRPAGVGGGGIVKLNTR